MNLARVVYLCPKWANPRAEDSADDRDNVGVCNVMGCLQNTEFSLLFRRRLHDFPMFWWRYSEIWRCWFRDANGVVGSEMRMGVGSVVPMRVSSTNHQHICRSGGSKPTPYADRHYM
jgi:hypothetical protein